MKNRVILIILDSLGIGALPDAHLFGDVGTNTLGHILDKTDTRLPNLERLGLGNLLSHPGLPPKAELATVVTRLATKSPGKDTITGHWEMMGLPLEVPFPTYPQGFPADIVTQVEEVSGRGILGNVAASGTEIIKELGQEHEKSGKLILYTSADSVLQIAAHEEVVPVEELHRICQQVHERLVSPPQVGRVIARPFLGTFPHYERTANRRDFSVAPGHTLLNTISQSGGRVIAVGKVVDIYAGQGIDTYFKTKSNQEGILQTLRLVEAREGSLIFTNLVDFDSLYGHRNDAVGYGRALVEFDESLPALLQSLGEDDYLILTADHGCDPTTPGTDHSREYVPGIIYNQRLRQGRCLADRESLCDIAATIADLLQVQAPLCGVSFADTLRRE